MSRSIKLTITVPVVQVIDNDTGYYVKFTLSNAVEMPLELFVHRVTLPSLVTTEGVEFSHVASPVDIEEYPVGLATVIYSDFFRTNEAEFLFKTIDLTTKTRLDFQSRVSDVVAKLNLLDTLVLVNTVNIEV
jgi:hypothetical protein